MATPHNPLNVVPPLCPKCGARHEPEYPHEATERMREYVRLQQGRAANYYDLVSHTQGLMREALMTELLRRVEV